MFFSSCNSVQFHAELLNYIDIPVMSIHVHARWWYQFSPLHSLSFSVPQRHRVITKRFAMAILADFFKKSGTVPYPVLSCRLSDA